MTLKLVLAAAATITALSTQTTTAGVVPMHGNAVAPLALSEQISRNVIEVRCDARCANRRAAAQTRAIIEAFRRRAADRERATNENNLLAAARNRRK